MGYLLSLLGLGLAQGLPDTRPFSNESKFVRCVPKKDHNSDTMFVVLGYEASSINIAYRFYVVGQAIYHGCNVSIRSIPNTNQE